MWSSLGRTQDTLWNEKVIESGNGKGKRQMEFKKRSSVCANTTLEKEQNEKFYSINSSKIFHFSAIKLIPFSLHIHICTHFSLHDMTYFSQCDHVNIPPHILLLSFEGEEKRREKGKEKEKGISTVKT